MLKVSAYALVSDTENRFKRYTKVTGTNGQSRLTHSKRGKGSQVTLRLQPHYFEEPLPLGPLPQFVSIR